MMSKISKRYWKWDDSLNSTEFKLGRNIQELIEKNLVKKNPNIDDRYSGINGAPWIIDTVNGKINSVFDQQSTSLFFSNNKELWDLVEDDLEKEINKILEPITKEYNGDQLHIVFRDFYVAIVGIRR